MTSRRSSAEIQADAVLAEASAIGRANAVLDQQLSDIAREKLDSVLQLIDVLIAARRIEVEDANWILPAMGYEVDIPIGRFAAVDAADDPEGDE